MVRVLVVEDDARLNQIVCASLRAAGYEAIGCANAAQATDALHGDGADIIISDIMMPGVDGFEFVSEVPQRQPAYSDSADDRAGRHERQAEGLRRGDRRLHGEAHRRGRAAASHRSAAAPRARIEAEKRLVVGSTVLDAEERSAYVGGKEITLTVREFDLLYKLLSYPRRTFSRAQLMDEFWDGETSASLRAVDVYITRIRDKMSVSDDFKITTVHGLGYKAVPGA